MDLESLKMSEAWIALRLTLLVAGCATLINLILGVGIAYLFSRKKFWGKEVLDAFLTLPMVMPPTVLGYYLLVVLGQQGVIGQFLKSHWGIQLIFTWQGAVIAAAIVSFPLIFKAARAAFESLEAQYEQAAQVLRVSDTAIFFRITLPLAWRGILAGLLLIPGQTQTLSIAVYEAVQAGQDDTANFLVLLTSIVCMSVLWVSGRLMPGRVVRQD
jgi:molybdate transport system permease protein